MAAAIIASKRRKSTSTQKEKVQPTPVGATGQGGTGHSHFFAAVRHFITLTTDDAELSTLARDITERRHEISKSITYVHDLTTKVPASQRPAETCQSHGDGSGETAPSTTAVLAFASTTETTNSSEKKEEDSDPATSTLGRHDSQPFHGVASAVTNIIQAPQKRVSPKWGAVAAASNIIGSHRESVRKQELAALWHSPNDAVYEFPTTGFWKHQKKVRHFYADDRVVIFVAGLIVLNFLVSVAEKQFDPGPVPQMYPRTWFRFALFFNVCFTSELGINMYSFLTDKKKDPNHFWTGTSWMWNYFDIFVVSLGLLGYIEEGLDGLTSLPRWAGKVRLMRAFRVFRLFKRVKSLNKIIKSLLRAIPGMMNAFLIMLIVMCIYAILGVEFYKYYGTCKGPSAEDDTLYDDNSNFPIGLDLLDEEAFYNCGGGGRSDWSPQGIVLDSRGVPFGDAYFGNFGKSLYTLFQVLTGDSWSEAIGRPLMKYAPSSVIFFVSFILVNPIILINVVIAVLLEKMVGDEFDEDGDEDAHVAALPNQGSSSAPRSHAHDHSSSGPRGFDHSSSGSSGRHNHDHDHQRPRQHDAQDLKAELGTMRNLLGEICKAQGITTPHAGRG